MVCLVAVLTEYQYSWPREWLKEIISAPLSLHSLPYGTVLFSWLQTWVRRICFITYFLRVLICLLNDLMLKNDILKVRISLLTCDSTLSIPTPSFHHLLCALCKETRATWRCKVTLGYRAPWPRRQESKIYLEQMHTLHRQPIFWHGSSLLRAVVYEMHPNIFMFISNCGSSKNCIFYSLEM